MDLKFSSEDEDFRQEVREWLEARLSGEFSSLRGRGGAGDQGELIAERKAWEQALGAAGWLGLSWAGRGARAGRFRALQSTVRVLERLPLACVEERRSDEECARLQVCSLECRPV